MSRAPVPRPTTLFTGQWTDLPFEQVARLAASWGCGGPGLRRPLDRGPRCLRERGRAVRARSAPERDGLRLLDDRARAGGHRPPAGLRAELGPEPHDVAGDRPGDVPVGLPRPDLP